MSVAIVFVVGVVGGIGAVARFALDGVVAGRVRREFPYGTLLVNVLRAFVLGVLVGAAVSHTAYRLPVPDCSERSRPSAPGRWRATGWARTGNLASAPPTSP